MRHTPSRVMPWLFALCLTACAEQSAGSLPRDHVTLVIEDVTAMVEGMAAAHDGQLAATSAPDIRSAVPPSR